MKKFLTIFGLAGFIFQAQGQFGPQPLKFPGPDYLTSYISITDPTHVWVGAEHITSGGWQPFSKIAKTSNGGNSWQFYDVTTGDYYFSDIFALDPLTCYATFYTMSGGSVWKTEDGGNSWINKTGDLFSGGFPNFYHGFSADTGLAGGDPKDGYFELYQTIDGGDSWARVPSANIPTPLPQEYGFTGAYCAVGNNIWFSTQLGRCFRSNDQGLTWSVSPVVSDYEIFQVCFSSDLKGVFYSKTPVFKNYNDCSVLGYNDYWVSDDGGITWVMKSLASNYKVRYMTRVPGFNGGFIISAYNTSFSGSLSILFTPDFFNSFVVIQDELLSTGESDFFDASTGWLAGPKTADSNIYNFNGVLVGFQELTRPSSQLRISPNPVRNEALIKFPEEFIGFKKKMQVNHISGEVVFENSYNEQIEWGTVQTQNLVNGEYLVTLISSHGLNVSSKLIVDH